MSTILVPPALPPFLASTYNLKPVEGVPNDKEVKMVHAVIRALGDVANVPALYDADLAVRLSMHLFSIQMARYRDRYPCIIFPPNITHTPPQLPAHIPVELAPVTGSPSDEQIKSVQTALRLYESMASIPSMFDANLSMKLSQHLFDIQFERYIRRVTDGDPSATATSSRAGNANVNEPDVADPPGVQNDASGRTQEQGGHDMSTTVTTASGSIQESTQTRSQHPRSGSRSSATAQDATELLEPMQGEIKLAELLKNGQEDANKLLVEVRDALKDVKGVLIVTQQSMARGLNRTTRYYSYGPCTHTLLNANGEEPHNLGFPNLSGFQYKLSQGSQVLDSDVARCLRFYGLGGEFVEEGDDLTIKEGKTDAATAELKSFFGF